MKISSYKNRLIYPCIVSGIFSGIVQMYGWLGLIIPITLVPFFMSVLYEKCGRLYIKKTVSFSISYYLTIFSFLFTIREFLPFSYLTSTVLAFVVITLLSLWQSIWLCICLFFGFYFRCGIKRALSISLLFVLGEHLQENNPLFTFAFTSLENSLAYFPQFIQPSAFFGGSFIAFLILFVSGLITVFASKRNSSFTRYISLFSVLLIVTVVYTFSTVRIKTYANNGKPVNALIIQTSVEGEEKYNLTVKDATENCIDLIENSITDSTDLILLPETSVPEYIHNEKAFFGLMDISQKYNTTIVSGCFSQNDYRHYNSLVAINPDNTLSKTYNKTFLVPFGEYAPFFEDFFKFKNLSPAKSNKPLDTCKGSFACAVCIESVFSDVTASQTKEGASLILMSTNDSWFGNSRGRNIHFVNSILRAVENDRYLLRSGNCGISAFISPTGKIKAADFNKSEGAISQVVYTNTKPSLYSVIGDIIILPCIAVLFLGITRCIKDTKKNLKRKGIFHKKR